jgi:ferredoxin
LGVSINAEKCIGCGVCVQVCPEVFNLDDEAGKGRIVDAARADEIQKLVKEAVDCCPIGCINW